MASVWLITGASRGIGLQLVKETLASNADVTIIAAARNPDNATELQALTKQYGDRLQLLKLDTADSSSLKAAAQWVADNVGRLDVLVNNAGITEPSLSSWEHTDAADVANVLATNVTGPLLLTAALAPLLRSSPAQHKVVANVSSSMGSVSYTAGETQKSTQQWEEHLASGNGTAPKRPAGLELAVPIYRASKAALNLEMQIVARDLAPDGVTVLLLHPGWVATDMGNSAAGILGIKAPVTPEQSAKGLLQVISSASLKDTGSFKDWEGKTVPW